MDPNIRLRNELILDAEQMCKRLEKVPSAILISGDIAFAAHAEEYAFALSWLEKLAEGCGTTIESVFVSTRKSRRSSKLGVESVSSGISPRYQVGECNIS